MQTSKNLDLQLEAARLLIDAGSQNLRQANVLAASDAMEEASAILDMAEESTEEVLKLRARVLNELGVVSQRKNQLDQARDYHREASKMCDELNARGIDFRGNGAATHLNLSSILVASGELDEALEAGKKAIVLIEALRADGQQGAEGLALGAHQNMALILARKGELDSADAEMTNAIELAKKLGEQGAPNISVQAAQGCQQLSVAMFEAQKFDRALSWGRVAAELSEKAYEAHGQPVLGVYIVSQINLISYHERLGQFAEAEDGLWKALEVAGNDAQIMRRGLAFYEACRKQADVRLEAGNLPREEVDEGYEEIKARIEAIGGLPALPESTPQA
ncbi:MAG: tetratricopeptide repeat protein [Bradymonadaceae bacterium]|nr:tetratricopeptide repeat protein [Lujinxingiaceae bacterium]